MSATILQFHGTHPARARRPATPMNFRTGPAVARFELAPTRTAKGEPISGTATTPLLRCAAEAPTDTLTAASLIVKIATGLVNDGWAHRCSARNHQNQACSPDDPEAVAWSADAAISLAATAIREQITNEHLTKTDRSAAPVGRTTAKVTKGLHVHHTGPQHADEILALKSVLETVELQTGANPRETLGMWNRSKERRKHEITDALTRSYSTLKKMLVQKTAKKASVPHEC